MKVPNLLTWALPSALALNIPLQGVLSPHAGLSQHNPFKPSTRETCIQAPKVDPPHDDLHSSLVFLKDAAFRARQVDRLSRAVRIPTTVGDYARDPYDKAFEPFVKFQELLEELFPRV